ncbi:hypothetical protein [Bradyrhizobium sp. YR681]|uniref:hypothetical protein n=1 Tax=Bradyrhizobium sp. YR681 TaxID=1144344 RepID=UPI0012F6AF6F|nr:hypothetical protein [Bradyrhizobium sp. YR681]
MKPDGAESLFFSANKEDRELLKSAAQAGEGRTARIRRGLRTLELADTLAEHQAKLMSAIAWSSTTTPPTNTGVRRKLYMLDDVIEIITLVRMKELWLRKANLHFLQKSQDFRAILKVATAAIRSDPKALSSAQNFIELAEDLFDKLSDAFATGANMNFFTIGQALGDYRDIISLYAVFDRILERPARELPLVVQKAMPDSFLLPPKK